MNSTNTIVKSKIDNSWWDWGYNTKQDIIDNIELNKTTVDQFVEELRIEYSNIDYWNRNHIRQIITKFIKIEEYIKNSEYRNLSDKYKKIKDLEMKKHIVWQNKWKIDLSRQIFGKNTYIPKKLRDYYLLYQAKTINPDEFENLAIKQEKISRETIISEWKESNKRWFTKWRWIESYIRNIWSEFWIDIENMKWNWKIFLGWGNGNFIKDFYLGYTPSYQFIYETDNDNFIYDSEDILKITNNENINQKPWITMVWFNQKVEKNEFNQKVNIIKNQMLEDMDLDWHQNSYDVICDIFDGFAYSYNPSIILQKYYQLLKPWAKAYIFLGDELNWIEDQTKRSIIIKKNWSRIWFIERLKELWLKIKNENWKSEMVLILEKYEEINLNIPELWCIEQSEELPPTRLFYEK